MFSYERDGVGGPPLFLSVSTSTASCTRSKVHTRGNVTESLVALLACLFFSFFFGPFVRRVAEVLEPNVADK